MPNFDPILADQLFDYIAAYMNYKKISPETLITHYINFIEQYDRDIKNFIKTGKYPFFLEPKPNVPTREEYDVVLMLSTVLTPHRYRIMQILRDRITRAEWGLIIGCGAGIEIELVKNSVKKLVAHDLDIDSFCKKTHGNVSFEKMPFAEKADGTSYDRILLIEMLEHIEAPYKLLASCRSMLRQGGEIFLTTATNLPQFDHLYNFPADHREFEEKVAGMNMVITFREDIPHCYIMSDIGARNTFFILKPTSCSGPVH